MLDNENILKLNVRDFTLYPGPGKKINNGTYIENSGEEFLEKHLLPKYNEAVASGKSLLVNMDGTKGYGPSFGLWAFKLLVAKTKDKNIKERLQIKSNDDPLLLKRIWEWIDEEIAKLD